MEESRFMYEIHPIKPINNLIPGRSIVTPCSMQLTKEEVLLCMKNANVWRRFGSKPMERVTIANLDQMHTPNGHLLNSTDTVQQAIKDAEHIVKLCVNPYNGDRFFITDTGEKDNAFTEKYISSTSIDDKNRFALINDVKGRRFPIEIIGEPAKTEIPDIKETAFKENTDSNKEDSDFLAGNGEESSATSYDVNSSPSKEQTKNKKSSNTIKTGKRK